jgi:hypothetical protein
MKNNLLSTTTSAGWLGQFALFILFSGICLGQTQPTNGTIQVNSSGYVCAQRGPNSKVWQETFLSTNDSGDVTTNSQSYTELGTGICYLTNNQYVDSVEEVDPVAGGAQAVQGRHQVQWALNANTPGGAVTVITPDAKQLSSTVFGLAYFDLATGSNAVIGQLKDCDGSIVNTNQVVYADAFSNVTADIVYTYTKAGLSQDIVLRQALLPPDAYGLNDASTIVQAYTEFMSAPEPEMTAVTNNGVVDAQILDFGEMKMAVGQAFFVNGQDGPVPAGIVSKQWVQVNNRTFLIEAISYSAISNQMAGMPHSSNLKPGRGSIRRLAFLEPKPSRSSGALKRKQPMKLAKADTTRPRLAIDYVLLSSTTNLTLQGDSTYFVSSTVNVTGTTTIEGGTVVKYTNTSSGQIIATNIVCQTGPYGPGVFTSMNDSTVGVQIGTNTPTIGPANYLNFGTLGANSIVLRNLRFSYANLAIFGSIGTISANSIEIWDCQFVNCKEPFSGAMGVHGSFPVNIYNVLFCGCTYGVVATNSSGHFAYSVVNVTADQVGTFFENGGTDTCNATNSVFTGTGMSGITAFSHCSTYATNTGMYTNVGAGGYYLVNGSTNQGTGTTNISTNLLADLQSLTTYPPVVTNGWLTTDYMFSPQALRDINGADRGYHYSPIDWAVNIAVSNAALAVLPGTVLAGYSTNGSNYAILLYTNGSVDCEGTATSPNYFVRYNTVQEQFNTNWATVNGTALLQTPNAADASWGNFAFTDWSVLANDGQITGSPALTPCPITNQDCQFYGGTIGSTNGPVFTVTNCLFHRVNCTVKDGGLGGASNTFCNNLFIGGQLTVKHGGTGQYTFRDNLFDQTTNTLISGTINVCLSNAYVTTNFGFLTPTNGDIFLTSSPVYQTGALGSYYYPTNLSLIHAGSQPAENAGLYFYTVLTNNVIEGDNTVSIGFHYVAVDSNGVPLDTDGIEMSDYLNDLSGNGVLNPFLIFDQSEYPNEPQVRLGYWRFNNTTNWTNEAGVYPTTATNLSGSNSFSGTSVSLSGTNFQLTYPVTTNGQNLFDSANGTVRFWFQPNWSTGTSFEPAGVDFLQAAGGVIGYWQFAAPEMLNSTNLAFIANVISFVTTSNLYTQPWGFSDTGLNGVVINFQSNVWYQIVLTYSPTNIALYTNGALLATVNTPQWLTTNGAFVEPLYQYGNGNTFYAPASDYGGLSVGNQYPPAGHSSGQAPISGQMDELETFNYPMTAQQVAAGFPYFGGNSTNMLDTYYIGRSDMLQTYVDGFSHPALTNLVPCRLGYWRFDSPLLYAEQGQMPLSYNKVGVTPSWSGTALVISNTDSWVT